MTKDVPLGEIILRKYEKPYQLESRELVKKICLSLGLLQPGDGRDVVVDILLVLVQARNEGKALSSEEIRKKAEKIRKEHSQEVKGLAESNVRRQLGRLRELMLVERTRNEYHLTEFRHLDDLFHEKIERFLIPQTVERVKEYLFLFFCHITLL